MKKILLCICKKIDAYGKRRENQKAQDELLFVSLSNDGVYINKVKIIDKKAKLQITIFKILMEKHLIGSLNSTPTGLNACQLSTALEKKGFQSFDLEKNIRQPIYQTKKNISQKFNKQVGESFISSSASSGQYRLAKNVVLICAEKTQL